MKNGNQLAALALAASMVMAWALPAQANGGNTYTVHPAAISLQWATQRAGDDCRGDAQYCIDRGRINTRDMAKNLCQVNDLPRDYRLVLLFPCTNVSDGWYISVWDRENERLADCGQLRFNNRMAIFAESNRGDLREMRILSDTQNVFNTADSYIGPSVDQLSATAVVRIAEVRSRLLEESQTPAILSETLEGVDSGIFDPENPPRCAASISTNSVLGILPEIGEFEENEASLVGEESIGLLMIEKGRIIGGRPIAIFDTFDDVQ